MQKWLLFSVAMLLTGMILGGGASQIASGASDDQYTKLTNAILSLHKRISTLELASKASASGAAKSSAAAGNTDKTAAELANKVSQLQGEVTSLKREISTLRADANANREALMVIHKRLTLLDSKSGTVKF